VFWISAVLAAVAAVGLFFVLPETHVPTLERRERNRQAGKRRPRTVMVELSADSDQPEKPDLARPRSLGWVLRRAVSMPVKIAFHAHCAVVLAVICIFNGLLNMIISSLGSVYQHRYHFPPTTAGLVYLGFGIGGVAGLGMARKLSRLTIRVLHLADRGPLNVLPFLSMAFVPPLVGLLIYGWMLEYPVFWFVPLIGVFLFFLGCVSVRLSTILFLVETVPDFPASALAAHTIASSIGGSILPLATFPLYEAVGYGWGNTVIAFANVGMCLIIILMYLVLAARMYGEGWDPRVKL
jgi:MFS family permease